MIANAVDFVEMIGRHTRTCKIFFTGALCRQASMYSHTHSTRARTYKNVVKCNDKTHTHICMRPSFCIDVACEGALKDLRQSQCQLHSRQR